MLGIPYIVPPVKTFEFGSELPLLGDHLTLGVFGPLVALGVLLGIAMAVRVYAKHKDLDEWVFRDQIFWVLVFGFVISHWVSVIFYFPERIAENPWVLLMLTNGLSSVGGFFGAFVGMQWFLRREKQPILVYADGNMFGLLLGMCFGRLSCALVHDHPGKIVEAGTFGAVGPWPCRCPEGRALPECCSAAQELWRWDLGLIEFVVILGLSLFVYFIWDWKKAHPGRLTGLVSMVYGPTRFLLDFLRESEAGKGVGTPDTRYLGLTPAQYFSLAFFAVGVWLFFIRKPEDSDLAYARDSDRKAKLDAKSVTDDSGPSASEGEDEAASAESVEAESETEVEADADEPDPD
ncbi:prolipoprotein diacylglyceryl transferase [Plesiocystis pacifica SIR-1]|uniref:Prolipoprotein diacylglyceryl transferase n=1 Tax=Plesiocystis pacifica SIR-1 TaxID=391625 RepID=A6GKE2_9BACT|nr:prolipoprotein diacylglyceryl transferase family protein [Plesiocystis pacifica]EDM73662.1 prolipoprotein diacylglyceryl transferase [Plesiocystis pacifica SIR-1]